MMLREVEAVNSRNLYESSERNRFRKSVEPRTSEAKSGQLTNSR
jgi:hypothetical protein